jgi:putative FmdB family regulatory protein
MPVYEYACKDCGEHLEVAQSFKDEALTVCPHCGGRLRKVFGSIGIAFKGSGFYRTDNRPAPRSDGGDKAVAKADKSPSASEGKGEASSAKSDSSSKPDGPSKSDSPSKSGAKTEAKAKSA